MVKALESAGLKYTDVKVSFLPPADARAAFEKGAVDAWVIWEPFLAAAEVAIGARQLADGTGLVNNHEFYLATRQLVDTDPKVVDVIIEAIGEVDTWANANLPVLAKTFSPLLGIPVPVLELAAERRTYGVQPISPDVVAKQQTIADVFFNLGLIPKAIKITDAVKGPQS